MAAGFQDLEEPALGGKVALEIAVVVEVVPGEVGENTDVEARALHAALDESVRRDFHRHRARATVAHRREQPEQIGGLRRGALRRSAWR